jgi:hypothetical protein
MNQSLPTYTTFSSTPPAVFPPSPVPVVGDVMDTGNLTDPGGGSTVVQPVDTTMPVIAQL